MAKKRSKDYRSIYSTYKKLYKNELKKGWVVATANEAGGINKALNYRQFKREFEIQRMNLKASFAEDTARKGKNPTTTQVMRQMIADAKIETTSESSSAYENLKKNVSEMRKKKAHGVILSETEEKILRVVDENGGLRGKKKWAKTGGGKIYKELKALGVENEGLGSP